MPLTVKDVMHEIITININKSALEAAQKVSEKKMGSVIVELGGEPTGIITERDLISAISVTGPDLKKMKCGDIMSSPLMTIATGARLYEATQLMEEKKVKKLLVRNQAGKIVGIVSMTDLLKPVTAIFDAIDIMRQFI